MSLLRTAMPLLALSLLLMGLSSANEPRVAKLSKPKTLAETALAPAFTLETTDGKKVSLSDFKGKGVIINFWATWCPPCRAEIPDMIELQKIYADKFSFIGIAVSDKPEKVAVFVKEKGINYPVVMGNEKVAADYGKFIEGGQIRGIPTSFVINRKGEIIDAFVGARDKATFESAIKRALN
ncbi:MAG: TlpA family protein disulfide reductase [Candidatus Thermochlorobacter sp.]